MASSKKQKIPKSTKTAASKKQAEKRTTAASRRSSSAGKGKNPSRTPSRQERAALTPEQQTHRTQVRAVILFAVSILLFCLVLIPGESLWRWLHELMPGLFGIWSILWPVLLMYIAIITAMEKRTGKLRIQIISMSCVILLCCACGFVFENSELPTADHFFALLGSFYDRGVHGGGAGLMGSLIGWPFLSLLGSIGSKIVILLILFVAIMLLTGTTLIQLFRTLSKPARAAMEVRERHKEERAAEQQAQSESAVIDIPLPSHPVQSSGKPAIRNEKQSKVVAAASAMNQPFELSGPNGALPERDIRPPANLQEAVAAANAAAVESGLPAELEEKAAAPVIPPADKLVETVRLASKEEPLPEKSEPRTEMRLKASVPEVLQSAPEKTAASSHVVTPEFRPEPVEEGAYRFPPLSLLEASRVPNAQNETAELQTNGNLLVQTLKSFGVTTKIVDISRGPSVTRYELEPAAGVKISKSTNLADDIAMHLAASGVRIEAPIPGKAAVGIEVPNKTRSTVRMRDLLESNAFTMAKSKLTVALGRDLAGTVAVADLAKMPHLLIAGTTGSGKSVCVNAMIVSILYKSTPDEVRFLLIDPKVVEFGVYNGIPHLLVPVVTDPRKAAGALNWAVTEMLKRYKIFAQCNVRDLSGYNRLAQERNYVDEDGQPMLHMPQIVIVIDELADLMMAAPNEVEDSICRLAQMARAAGMHLVVATQRPSVDVVTGLIKANIPSRIALTVSNGVDSLTILDSVGAEKLLGQGDMLFSPIGAQKPMRIQGCFVSDSEIESIVNYVKKTKESEYDTAIMDEIEKNAVAEHTGEENGDSDSSDPMMNEAIKCVVEAGQASTSLLQRRLRLGYARAGRLIDEMEQMGIVGPHEGSKPRAVLMTYQQYLERQAQQAE